MKMTLKLTLFIGILALAACAPKKEDGEVPITATKPELVAKQDEIDKGLQDIKLAYQSDYRSFSANQTPLVPCDAAFLTQLSIAKKMSFELQSELSKQNKNLLRGEALEFQKRVDDTQKSLTEIGDLIVPYCLQEHKAVTSCLSSRPDPLRVFVNLRVAGYMTVHPMWIPNRESAWMFLTSLDETGVRAKNIETGDYPAENDVSLLLKSTSRTELRLIANCLEKSNLQTPVALQVQKSLAAGILAASQRCIQLDRLVRSRRVTLTDYEKDFCYGNGVYEHHDKIPKPSPRPDKRNK